MWRLILYLEDRTSFDLDNSRVNEKWYYDESSEHNKGCMLIGMRYLIQGEKDGS